MERKTSIQPVFWYIMESRGGDRSCGGRLKIFIHHGLMFVLS